MLGRFRGAFPREKFRPRWSFRLDFRTPSLAQPFRDWGARRRWQNRSGHECRRKRRHRAGRWARAAGAAELLLLNSMVGMSRSVALRRRVDWELILGKNAPVPAMLDSAAPSELASLIAAFDELIQLEDTDATLR